MNLPRLPVDVKIGIEIKRLFGKDVWRPSVFVVQYKGDDKIAEKLMAAEAAKHLRSIVRSGYDIAVGFGSTIISTILEIPESPGFDAEVYPLAGGPLYRLNDSVSSAIVMFRTRWDYTDKDKWHVLPAPPAKAEDVQSLHVARILKKAENADIFLIDTEPISSAVSEEMAGWLNIDMKAIMENKVVGTCVCNAFDENGDIVDSEFDTKIVKVSGDCIKKAACHEGKHVLLVSRGTEKSDAIRAMLRGGWCNCIVTDKKTAEAVLS